MQKSQLVVLSSAFLLGSCSAPTEQVLTKLGKLDSHPKGYIEDDLPEYSSSQMRYQNQKNIINPALKWQHLDLAEDKNYGVSSDKAYLDFNLTQSKEIIVAVIDSGVDHNHEDLNDVMWVNKKEIPENGIDDDSNGYVDDIYGWNFLGGSGGKNIGEETLEETRIYARLLKRIEAGEVLTKLEKGLFKKVKDLVTTNLEKYSKRYKEAIKDRANVSMLLDILKVKLGIQTIEVRRDLEDIESKDPQIVKIRKELLGLWDKYWRGFPGIKRVIDSSGYYVNVGYNIEFDERATIIGDDPNDFSDKNYGNNDVIGPDASHGTHVAGIIAAKRGNDLGMDGIADNVKIMALRAVPDGDERDKDIALAVRYAVDNGAHIINMSFGKKFSPYKSEVDKAFKYAASKGVLLVHAAGNSSLNIDGGNISFPNHYVKDGSGVLIANKIPNWLEIGASTKNKALDLIASFSNYGNEAVSFFSPGHRIYSTTPNNRYAAFSGTSMAAPVAAGVAALLMSEYKNLSASTVKTLLEKSVSKPADLNVSVPTQNPPRPDLRHLEPFKDFSVHDGVVNAYSAIEEIQGQYTLLNN